MNNKNKILIINSLGAEAIRYIGFMVDVLADRYDFIIRPANCRPANTASAPEPACAIYIGPILHNGNNSSFKHLAILLLFPFLFLYNLVVLYQIKRKYAVSRLFLTNWNEKIILTAAANLLGLRTYWLELKYFDKKISSWPEKIIYGLYRILSRRILIISASEFIREQLANRLHNQKEITVISPSVKLNGHEHQENIFESMAKKDYLIKQRKFFTVGTICRLDETQKMESLFNAVNLCLETVPNLQIIVVGEGREKKNLSWLAKKIAVENVVWFVGGQERPKKWLNSFDLFVLPVSAINLNDFYTVLEAMSVGLPIIGPKNFGLEDLVVENKNGSLIEFDNPEMLAGFILKLEQNTSWRRDLGKNSKEKIENYFTMQKMSDKLNTIIN
jgi:glycosyltransferase involved in cell wall biosynthesis